MPYPRNWRALRIVSFSASSSTSSESSSGKGDGMPETRSGSTPSFLELAPLPPRRSFETLLTAAKRPCTQTLCVRRFVGISRLVSGSRLSSGMSASSLEWYAFLGRGRMVARSSRSGGSGGGGVYGRDRIVIESRDTNPGGGCRVKNERRRRRQLPRLDNERSVARCVLKGSSGFELRASLDRFFVGHRQTTPVCRRVRPDARARNAVVNDRGW